MDELLLGGPVVDDGADRLLDDPDDLRRLPVGGEQHLSDRMFVTPGGAGFRSWAGGQ